MKKIRELKHKQPITDDAMNKVLTATDTPKTGNGFYLRLILFWIILFEKNIYL